jgi:tRNA pseudouridine38-40 synthase
LEANRFLHKMVRSIVGACFDVARGALPETLTRDVLAGNHKGERTWAPAHGLCLEQVKYRDYEY